MSTKSLKPLLNNFPCKDYEDHSDGFAHIIFHACILHFRYLLDEDIRKN